MIFFLAFFRQKASGFISARVAVQARVQGAPTDGATSIDAAGAASGEAGASSFGASCRFEFTFETVQ